LEDRSIKLPKYQFRRSAMAGACRASLSFLSPPPVSTTPTARFRLKQILSASASLSLPSKAKRRKNYLRTKILKTLTKPLPTIPPPETAPAEPPLPVATPPQSVSASDEPSTTGEVDEVESLQVSQTVDNAGKFGGIIGKISADSVFKLSAFVIGFFVLETLVVQLLFGTSEKGKNALVSESGNDKLGSPFGDVNEVELGEKIAQIRAMAREARESEKRKLPKGEQEIGIENEVSARLVKLQKNLHSKKDVIPGSLINSLGLFGNGEDDSNDIDVSGEDEESVPLMFKKKHRFKSPSVKTRSTPKGFSGSKDSNGSVKGNMNGASRKNGVGATRKEKGMKAGSSQGSPLRNGENVVPKKETLRNATESGAVQGAAEATNSKKGGIENLSVTKENTRSNKNSDSVDSSSHGNGKRPVKNNLKDKRSALATDIWWSKLPYVLAILVQRTEHEGEGGFYVIKDSPEAADQRNSYTVAFQDRSDANNFCFLLESFLEGLEDLSVDIVPLPVKELHEAVKSESKKVVVVRKGQLKLYAGQPLEEVEITLRSMIEQNQRAGDSDKL
ncbi:hypothetical protein LINGRAHAP2_LOCUS20903, partial [Linum grandiflorum]